MAPGPEVGHGSSDLTVAAAAWSLEVAEIFWLVINIFAECLSPGVLRNKEYWDWRREAAAGLV